MCGIIGSINKEITPELLNMIKHRGPDRQAIWNNRNQNNEVYLAHTRLSIVDLSDAGNQPMISECGNYIIIFNGEVYNHNDLRKNISFTHFKGHSDTETLLYYMIEKGISGIKDLNGIFSFSFYDIKNEKMFIARDKYGVKPLYYYFEDNKFMFSSEIHPIKATFPFLLNRKSLSVLLSLRYIPSPYTLFDGIEKLRPGHYLSVDLSKKEIVITIHNYDEHHVSYLDLSFNEAVELYKEKFNKAVERQMMSDVDLGILLSGGIDSALVASAASKYSDKKIKAFTVGFDSDYAVNEIDLAAETAKYFGLEHNVVTINSNSFFDIFRECSSIVEEPLATTSFIPMYYLSKLASESVKVVLTGQGADEPLGGYGRYQGEILHDKCPSFMRSAISKVIELSGTKKETLIRGSKSLPITDDILRYLNVYSLFTPNEIKLLIGEDVLVAKSLIEYYYKSLNCSEYKTSAERIMSIDQRMNLSDDLLLYTDKITMNFSMECRVPMLDHELIDFLDSLPIEYKVTKGNAKIIHKAYAKSVLPESFINRPKLGFQSPTDIWFRESFSKIESELIGTNSKLLSYLDKGAITNVLKQHKKGYNRDKQIFLLLSLEYWLKANNL